MKIINILLLLFIASCSSNSWKCPNLGYGKPCRSISAVDNSEFIKVKEESFDKSFLLNNKKIIVEDMKPSRSKEEVGRILITPYIDKDGNLNSAKFIYTIDKEPEWEIN